MAVAYPKETAILCALVKKDEIFCCAGLQIKKIITLRPNPVNDEGKNLSLPILLKL